MKRILRVLMLLSLITIPTLVQAAISVTFTTTTANRITCNVVNANFSASVTGCSGTPTYTWYFIKNPAVTSADTVIGPSTGPSIFWLFNSPGTYNVLVKAKCGTDSAYHLETDYIQITPQPVVNFTANVPLDPASACAGPVTLTNTTVGDTFCTPHVWQWIVSRTGAPDMLASTTNATFDMSAPGDYSVKLVYIGGPCGCVDDTTKVVHIVPYPTACFTRTDAGNDCNAPVNATFSAACSSSDVTTYAWTFLGGSPATTTSSSPSAATTFGAPGNYSVSVTVTNSAGCSATSSSIGIHVGNLVAYMRPIPDTVCEGDIIHLEDSTTVDVIAPSFNIFRIFSVDLSTVVGLEAGPTADVPMPGTGLFQVCDEYTNGNGCTATMCRYIYVRPRPNVLLTIDDEDRYRCQPPVVANFHATPPTASYTYVWTFETGSTFTGVGSAGANPPAHTYTDFGVYNPTLTVTDVHSCSVTVVGSGMVTITPPVFELDRYVDSGCAPINVCFNLRPVVPNPAIFPAFEATIDGATYDDGSGVDVTAAYGDTFCHTYVTNGNFLVTVNWHTPDGCSGLDTTRVLIGGVLPDTIFTRRELLPDSTLVTGPLADSHVWRICPSHGIRFEYTGDPLNTVNWRILNGTGLINVDTNKVDVIYPTPSTAAPIPPGADTPFRYILTACRNGCCLKDTGRIYVYPPPIQVNSLGATVNCANKNLVSFSCLGTDSAVRYFWEFRHDTSSILSSSDTITTTVPSVVHLYPGFTPATVVVKVTAYGPAPGNCPVSDTLLFFRKITDTSFTMSDTAICKGESISVVGPHQPDTTAYPSYTWTWGDGSPSMTITNDSLASHTYTATGVYTVGMTFLSAYGCGYSGGTRRVRVYGPNINFTVAPNPVCLGDAVTLTDLSTFPGSALFRRTISWSYPGSLLTVVPNAPLTNTNTYTAEGSYVVAVSDTDASVKKCGAVATQTVNVVRVHPYFTTPDVAGACAGLPITFVDSNTHSTYAWNFGDGVTTTPSSSTQTVTHTYSANGTYTVTVTVIADGTGGIPAGCQGSYSRVITISNESGIDITNFADTASACPPLFIAVGPSVTPTSYLYTYTWTVSQPDSLVYNGSYLFTSLTHSGDHLVSLIATSPRGCKDTATAHYVVGGPTGTLSVTPVSGCAPATVVVTFTSTGITPPGANYIWNTCPDGSFTTTTPSITLTYNTPGTYCPPTLFIESGGCAVPFDNFADSIRIFPTPTVSVTHAPRICYGGRDTLYASGTDSYAWYGPSGLICSGCSFIVVNPLATTNYTVVGTNTAGCSDSEIVTVNVDPPLAISISGVDSMCLGETTTLTASGGSGVFLWHAYPTTGPDLGISCAVCNPVTITSTITRTYWAISTNVLGCTDSASHTVVINPLPILTYNPNPAYVCEGIPKQITMNGAAKYLWEPLIGLSCDSCASPFVSLTNNLIYTVTGTTIYGCRDSITVPVEVYHHNVTGIRPDTTICYGDGARMWVEGGMSYVWRPGNSLTDSTIYNPFATPTVTTTYTVYIKENPCFDTTRTVKVTVIPTPVIKVPPTTIIVAGNSVQLYADALNAVTLTGWAWTPADSTLTCTDCPHPIATPVVTTTYSVTANTIEGCNTSATVTVKLLCQSDQVFIPNTFTPNGDGVNDRFYVSGKGLGLIKRMAIYNRWGEMVYEAYDIRPNDVGPGWDGTFRGEVLAPDVYIYVLDVLCSTGEPFVFRGDISLVR